MTAFNVTASVTRPADTTAYASGDLLANSTTAGSVVPLSFALGTSGRGGMVRRLRARKSSAGLTSASFRLHLYRASPTPSNGDNGAWLTDQSAAYLGAFDVTFDRAFTDGAYADGVPTNGSEITFASDMIFGLLEARGAYTPASAEVIALTLECWPN